MPHRMPYGPLGARTLRAWMHRTGHSQDSVAAALAEHGIECSPQLVGQWSTGAGHLPFAVVPVLASMERPEVWTQALERAIRSLSGDEPTEDAVPLPTRALRAIREAGEVVALTAEALADGRIDATEARRLRDEVREALVELERLHAALDAVADVRRVRA